MSETDSEKSLLSIVIPAWNESEVIDELSLRLTNLINKISNYHFEVIIVDNGSRDKTWEKLQALNALDPRFKIIQLTRNFTADGAIQAGLALAKGEAAIMMDADLQDPPELIEQFLSEWEKGSEIVLGSIQNRQGELFLKRSLSRIYYSIIHKITKGMIPENVTGFRLMDKKAYNLLNSMKEHNRFTRGLSVWAGFRSTSIPFVRPKRFAGKSKSPFRDLIREAWDGIYAFSYFPLKLPFIAGWVSLISSMLVIIGIFCFEIPALGTLIALILALFGMMFLFLGVMGSYIARITDEVRQRPTYVIRLTEGFGE